MPVWKTGPQNLKIMKTDIRNFRMIVRMTLTMLAVVAIFPSCVTYYAVVPEVHPDGSMTRTVYAEADSACLAGDLSSQPFLFEPGLGWETGRMAEPRVWWFLDDSATMNFYASRTFRPSDTSYREIPASEEYAGLPYVKARERWDRKRGLLFNTYSYSCTFPGIAERMPVPPDSLMTRDELDRWFRSAGSYSGMNGAEAYTSLTDLYDKYAGWINACYREQIYRVICSAVGEELTDSLKTELMQWMKKHYDFYEDMLFAFDGSDGSVLTDIAGQMSRLSGSPIYVDAAAVRATAWEEELSALEEKLTAPFCYEMLYQVRMPGRLTSANTELMDDGIPVWKVDGFRLLAGDLTIETTSRRANPLGFILLGLIVLASAILFFRPRR